MNASELRAAIDVAEDLPRVPFPTPEWPAVDGQVYLRGLTAQEADDYEIFLANHTQPQENGQATRPLLLGTVNVRARVAVKGIVDVDGRRLFADTEEDIKALGAKAMPVIDRAYEGIRRLSGMTRDAQEALEKNSVTSPGGCSPST